MSLTMQLHMDFSLIYCPAHESNLCPYFGVAKLCYIVDIIIFKLFSLSDNLRSAATNGMLLGASKGIVYLCIGISYIVGAHIFTVDSSKGYYADIAEIFTSVCFIH